MGRCLSVMLLLLSGCAMYPAGNIPRVEEFVKTGNVNCAFKPKCLIKGDVNSANVQAAEWIRPFQKNAYEEVLNESGLFKSYAEVSKLEEADVTINASCNYVQDLTGAFLTGFSIMTIPFAAEHRFTLAFDVSDRFGRVKQYRFKETVVEREGLLLLFALPFIEGVGASYDEAFTAMFRDVMRAVLVKMCQDGFFSTTEEGADAEAGNGVAEVLKKNVAARRKELEDLKKAGIIDEVDFATETKKLEGIVK